MRLIKILLLLTILGAGALGVLFISLSTAYAGFEEPVFVDIPRGTGTRQVAEMLADAGVIRHPLQLLAVRALRPRAKLQAGEYLFKEPASPFDVFGRIARGDIYYHALAVPEGDNIFDIAASLDRLGILSSADFLREARNPALIRDIAPQAPSLEGYLFPDTYHVTRRTTAHELVRMMTGRFRKVWNDLGGSVPVHDAVTLASLVEKEAQVASERPLVASVYVNRLRMGMPLQCDPTTIYAALLENRYRGGIYRSDLDSKHPYNTYQNRGLPPGPIANPGVEALKAALNPAQTEYVYFVALPDGSGAHEFSREFAEHARAVQRYRRGTNGTRQDQPADSVPRGTPPGGRHGDASGGASSTPRPGV